MKTPNFVTATELDPFTSTALNIRFSGFLVRLAEEFNLSANDVVEKAVEILRDAEIPQPGDDLIKDGPEIDVDSLKAFDL